MDHLARLEIECVAIQNKLFGKKAKISFLAWPSNAVVAGAWMLAGETVDFTITGLCNEIFTVQVTEINPDINSCEVIINGEGKILVLNEPIKYNLNIEEL